MTDASAVAVVGMSGRFPGARDLAEYWGNLRGGACSIRDFSETELLAAGVGPELLGNPGYVPSKGFLAEAGRFEAELFGFSRGEAAVLDPQHRLLLETAWAALEDAGYDPRHAPARTGVYVGGGTSEHMIAAHADPRLTAQLGPMHMRILTDRDFLAPWISYRLGLTGPSMTVQTACSTSLTAVHVATQALLLDECDTALAGGVAVDTVAKRGYVYQTGGIVSPDGRCRPFDAQAAGTVGGNGAGLVVLRRLADAIADADPIRAVIVGSAVTNDGSVKVGFTSPGVGQQTRAIREAWAVAGLDPAAAQYLEAHGTGTQVGDRIELAAALRAPDAPALPDVGHTLRAGRAALAVRACVIARSAADAATALESIAAGRDRPAAPVVPATPGAPAELRSLAERWVRGDDIKWPAVPGRRVHLPTYPFAGDGYGELSLTPPGPRAPASAPVTGAATEADDEPIAAAVTKTFMTALDLADDGELDRTYFAAGGDSLTAVHLVGELRDKFGLDVAIKLFLEELPVRDIIAAVLAPPEDALLESLLDEIAD